jgi:hypothetical protein
MQKNYKSLHHWQTAILVLLSWFYFDIRVVASQSVGGWKRMKTFVFLPSLELKKQDSRIFFLKDMFTQRTCECVFAITKLCR